MPCDNRAGSNTPVSRRAHILSVTQVTSCYKSGSGPLFRTVETIEAYSMAAQGSAIRTVPAACLLQQHLGRKLSNVYCCEMQGLRRKALHGILPRGKVQHVYNPVVTQHPVLLLAPLAPQTTQMDELGKSPWDHATFITYHRLHATFSTHINSCIR